MRFQNLYYIATATLARSPGVIARPGIGVVRPNWCCKIGDYRNIIRAKRGCNYR